MATTGSASTSTGPIQAVGATGRVHAVLRDLPGAPGGLLPGQVLRLTQGRVGGEGGGAWQLASLDSDQVLTLLQPPLEDLMPGDQLLLRVRTVSPRLELEVLERRSRSTAGASDRPSDRLSDGAADASSKRSSTRSFEGASEGDGGWAQFAALRGDLAAWRRQMLSELTAARAGDAARPTPLTLAADWAMALSHGRAPMGPGGEPFWLLPLAYWVRDEPDARSAPHRGADRSPDPSSEDAPGADPALSLLLKWRGAAIGLQLQGPRDALRLTLLAENDVVLAALRAELPRLVAALVRAGFRLSRLGWRRQALWVPADPPSAEPPLPVHGPLLQASATLVVALQ
jgi:hypothetical protein